LAGKLAMQVARTMGGKMATINSKKKVLFL
jgi:hypothetical protein